MLCAHRDRDNLSRVENGENLRLFRASPPAYEVYDNGCIYAKGISRAGSHRAPSLLA